MGKKLIFLFFFFFLVKVVSAETIQVNYTIKSKFAAGVEVSDRPPILKTTTGGGRPITSGLIENKICQVFGKHCNIAIAIAKAESGLKSNAIGDGGCSLGIFQVNQCVRPYLSREKLLNPDFNIREAYKIFLSSGWNAWSVFINGEYLKFL